MSITIDVPVWTDDAFAADDEALWVAIVNAVARHDAARIARDPSLAKRLYATREDGSFVVRWACEKTQIKIKGIDAVVRDGEGCCSDLSSARAGDLISQGKHGHVEVELEDRSRKGRPYHALVVVNGEPEETDISEAFGMNGGG